MFIWAKCGSEARSPSPVFVKAAQVYTPQDISLVHSRAYNMYDLY